MTWMMCAVLGFVGCKSAQVGPTGVPAGVPQGGPLGVDRTLEVISFNIRMNTVRDGLDAWPLRREAVLAIAQRADLLGVQEALPDMLREMDERLPGMARIGLGREADGGGEACSLFYRADRLECLAEGTFWLSESPGTPGTMGWDPACPRVATWGRFQDRQSGARMVVVNTHFDHAGPAARLESAKLLVVRLGGLASGDPLVLMGDFNATEASEPYRVLTVEGSLSDARLTARTPSTGPAATWNGFGRDELTRRIDFVFGALGDSGAAFEAFTTIDDTIGEVLGTQNGRYPSDHFPVQARVSLPQR